jgi:hypothetical protein
LPLWLQSLLFRRQAITRIQPPPVEGGFGDHRAGVGRLDVDMF